MAIQDGSAQFEKKTITSKEYVDGKLAWTVEDLTPIVPYTLASWGFCRIAYNANTAMVSFSGLKLNNAYTSPTAIFRLPVRTMAYFAYFLHIDSTDKICTATVDGNVVQINGYKTANSYLYGSIVIPLGE